MLQAATLIVFPALMVFAALSDLFTMTISNRVSLILLAAFPLFALAAGMDGWQIAAHLGCGLGVLALTVGMFARGWVGGGDAKLAAATAVWIGFDRLGDYGLDTAVLGGMLTLAILYGRSIPLPRFMIGIDWVARLHHRSSGIPYGIALAAAGLIVYPDTLVWSIAAGV